MRFAFAVRLAGLAEGETKSREFLTLALGRAYRLGEKAAVFGSPESRSVPAGVPTAVVREQMIVFRRLCADGNCDSCFGRRLAVEPVNHNETNFINTLAAAQETVGEVERAEIGLAAHIYHFAMEREGADILLEAPDLLCNVLLANPAGPCFLKPGTRLSATP